MRHALVLSLVATLVTLAAAAPASARDGRDDRPEVRVAGTCSIGVKAKLRLKADDGEIELELEVDESRAGATWRVALVHERRVAWKGAVRTTAPSGSFEVRRTLPDLPGFDTVTARAWGPRGLACRATATLAGS